MSDPLTEVKHAMARLTFDEKREMVWEDYSRSLISEVRAEEMLREIGYQEEAAKKDAAVKS